LKEPLKELNVSVFTWNHAQCSPSKADCQFLLDHGDSSVIVVGVQEVEDLKPRRHEGSRSRALKRVMLSTLGGSYAPVVMTSLGAIHLYVFVRKDATPHLKRSSVVTWEVACGIGNVVQNKGALGVRMVLAGKSLMFFTAHLAAHQSKIKERNADFWRIMKESEAALAAKLGQAAGGSGGGIELGNRRGRGAGEAKYGDESAGVVVAGGKGRRKIGPIIDGTDYVFFGGDLNYRLDLSREEVELSMLCDTEQGGEVDPLPLLEFDQLLHARAARDAFGDFEEGRISFPPTFKFDKRTDSYDTSRKRRIPAWTDRILFKAKRCAENQLNPIKLREYGCISHARHSDHRPVFARFAMPGNDA